MRLYSAVGNRAVHNYLNIHEWKIAYHHITRMAQIMIEVAVMDVVEILKALGDGTRLRILHLLYKETLCVGHL
jgi:hypothetical protein